MPGAALPPLAADYTSYYSYAVNHIQDLDVGIKQEPNILYIECLVLLLHHQRLTILCLLLLRHKSRQGPASGREGMIKKH